MIGHGSLPAWSVRAFLTWGGRALPTRAFPRLATFRFLLFWCLLSGPRLGVRFPIPPPPLLVVCTRRTFHSLFGSRACRPRLVLRSTFAGPLASFCSVSFLCVPLCLLRGFCFSRGPSPLDFVPLAIVFFPLCASAFRTRTCNGALRPSFPRLWSACLARPRTGLSRFSLLCRLHLLLGAGFVYRCLRSPPRPGSASGHRQVVCSSTLSLAYSAFPPRAACLLTVLNHGGQRTISRTGYTNKCRIFCTAKAGDLRQPRGLPMLPRFNYTLKNDETIDSYPLFVAWPVRRTCVPLLFDSNCSSA